MPLLHLNIHTRDYSGAAPLFLGTLLDWLQGEGGLLSGNAVTDARLAFVVGQIRAIMAAAAAAIEATAMRGRREAARGSSGSGVEGGGDLEDYLTSQGASTAVVPLLSMVSHLVLEEPSAYEDSGGDSGGGQQGGEVRLQKHCWWVRAQMAMAAADLFLLDAEALNRGGGGQMGGVDEALIQVRMV